jgi:hypothetical protein
MHMELTTSYVVLTYLYTDLANDGGGGCIFPSEQVFRDDVDTFYFYA